MKKNGNNSIKNKKKLVNKKEEHHDEYMNLYRQNCQNILTIEKLKKENEKLNVTLNSIWNSTSWKITKPLRYISRKVKKIFPMSNATTEYSMFEIKNEDIKRISIDDLLVKFSKYDVVSFDIFDTLILRNVNRPTDLFRLVGNELGFENFEDYRIKAEEEARKISRKKNYEIDIYDIYDVLRKYIKIDVNMAIEKEFSIEKDFCIANPYLREVYEKLLASGKKIIIISDMYWPKDYLIKLLNHCGYKNFENIFVSCEYQENKGNGRLQAIAKEKVGKKYSYIHIGDNYQSDILGSKKNNWGTFHYKKCSDISTYKTIDNSLVSSINYAIVNNYFYNSNILYNPFFEYGFKYGGILVCGFCQWLNDFAKKNRIDKILFLARDMKVVEKIYNEFYNEIDNEYVIISRSAALELNFENMTEEFIEFYFKSRIDKMENLKDILIDSDLEILIDRLGEYNLQPLDILSAENYDLFKSFIYANKKIVIDYFHSSVCAATKYLKEKIKDCKNIAVVDLGWGGQILIQLRHFIKDNISKDINVVGAYMANSSNTKVNNYIESGVMNSFLFSYASNNNFLLNTTTLAGNTKAMFLEAMFSSSDPTLLKYDLDDDNNYKFIYGISSSNKEMIEGITDGITKFAEIYNDVIKNYKYLKISSVDAYSPFNIISDNYGYNYYIFKDVKEYKDSLPRFKSERKLTTIGNIIKDRNLL